MENPQDFWNKRYSDTEYAFGEAPNEFLKQALNDLSISGKILFPAEGEGRNAVYAAKKGLDVYAFDISEEGKRKALDLSNKHKVSLNYEVGEFPKLPLTNYNYNAAALIFAHFPSNLISRYHQKIAKLIHSGGYVVLEGFSKNHLAYKKANTKVGGPGSMEMLFSIEGIQRDFKGFDVLQLTEEEVILSEGKYHQGIGKVIRFIGRKI